MEQSIMNIFEIRFQILMVFFLSTEIKKKNNQNNFKTLKPPACYYYKKLQPASIMFNLILLFAKRIYLFIYFTTVKYVCFI